MINVEYTSALPRSFCYIFRGPVQRGGPLLLLYAKNKMRDTEAVCDCVLFLHGGKGRGNRARRADVPAPARSAIAHEANGKLAMRDAHFEHLPRVIRHPYPTL